MGNDSANRYLERLVEPVEVKDEDKIGNSIGNDKNSPVRKKNQIPRKKPRQNLEQSMDGSVVSNKKFAHFILCGGKAVPHFLF